MNQGAREANADLARRALQNSADRQIELLKEIRNLLQKLLTLKIAEDV